jgi:hypothetical protein
LDVVVHAYNPRTGRMKQKEYKFKASLGYIARFYGGVQNTRKN